MRLERPPVRVPIYEFLDKLGTRYRTCHGMSLPTRGLRMPTKKERGKAKRTQSSRAYARRPPSPSPTREAEPLSAVGGGEDSVLPMEDDGASTAVDEPTSASPATTPEATVRTKLRHVTDAPAADVTIVLVGIAAFLPGLGTPFQGDDLTQIVNNPPVQSITNIVSFFRESTFYFGPSQPLRGAYYRPLMTTVDSSLYTAFGATPLAFHLFQLALCIGSAVILHHFLRYFVGAALSLILALVFLVHPVNSQVVFAIPSMDDALFFFFGILALWLLVRFRSRKILFVSGACLFLSLLSKETGILFVALALAFLFWRERRRLLPFAGIVAVAVVAWLLLRSNAIGWVSSNANEPIDLLSLGNRLISAPAIVLFYITQFVWPVPLASTYDWTAALTVQSFVIPLTIDLAVITAAVYIGILIGRRGTSAQYRTYWFFAVWASIGILAHLQIIPLDATVSDTYAYFSMAGVLGMIGIAVSTLGPHLHVNRLHLNRQVGLACVSAVILLLGIRTAIRGTDWSSSYTLATHDVAVSPDDYIADITVAKQLASDGNFAQAITYAKHSVSVYPSLNGYDVLGTILLYSQDYSQARQTYLTALAFAQTHGYGNTYTIPIVEQLGSLTWWYGSASDNNAFLTTTLKVLPRDGTLWLDLAVVDLQNHDSQGAKTAITNAYALGAVPEAAYNQVIKGGPITFQPRPSLPIRWAFLS
jgi:hypothetical protein